MVPGDFVKPFPGARLDEALDRARRRRGAGREDGVATLVRDLGPRPDRLLVPQGDRLIAVPIEQIAWIGAEGDYARLHTAGGESLFVSRSLAEVERRLDPAAFVRIHRSAIVRIDQIREVHPEGSGRYRLTLADGTALIVSRTRAERLRRWML